MASKTPQFDKALADYFAGLKLDKKGGQERTCRFSREKFYVRPDDISFYKKIGSPLPTLEPSERWRKLCAYQNTQTLFKIKSAHSGKQIIAAYPPNTPFKIYEHQIWYSDKWNPMDYAREWDPARKFFEQFAELRKDVPRPNLVSSPTNLNSDYTNASSHLKNCYLSFNSGHGENLQYVDASQRVKDCVLSEGLLDCDTCYLSRDMRDSYRLFFCEESRNCLDSSFLFDCRNCEHCFMSSNLRNKKYVFRNQQLSKADFEAKMKEVDFGKYDQVKKYRQEFKKLKENSKRKPDHNFRAVNSFGDYIETSKNCYWCLFVFDFKDCAYVLRALDFTDSYDIVGGMDSELCYEFTTIATEDNERVRFSSQIDNSENVEYSDMCRNCHDVFGCVGLRNKSFCILNKQYKESDYWKLLDEIKTAMLADGTYGEFFPPELMPLPYKTTLASIYPGFRDYGNAGRYGYDMSDAPVQKSEARGEIIEADDLPNDIKETKDDILKKTIFDKKNEKYFQLTPYQLAFHKRHNLALPREHPLVMLQDFREAYDIKLIFYERKCEKCGKQITSTYDPKKYANVYCEPCYQQEIG